jgi:hypothetical protein
MPRDQLDAEWKTHLAPISVPADRRPLPVPGGTAPFPAGAPPPSQPVLYRPLPGRGSAAPSQGCPFPVGAPPSHHRAGALLPGRPLPAPPAHPLVR